MTNANKYLHLLQPGPLPANPGRFNHLICRPSGTATAEAAPIQSREVLEAVDRQAARRAELSVAK